MDIYVSLPVELKGALDREATRLGVSRARLVANYAQLLLNSESVQKAGRTGTECYSKPRRGPRG